MQYSNHKNKNILLFNFFLILLFFFIINVPFVYSQNLVENFTVDYFRELLTHFKENSSDYCRVKLNLGVAYTIDGDYESARTIFRELRTSEINFKALHNLFLTELVLGEKDEAEEILESAPEVGMGAPISELKKLFDLSSDEVKIVLFRGETQQNPTNWRAFARLGSVQAKLNKFQDAVSAYSKAINIKKDEPDLYNSLGEAYGKLNQLDNALENFQKAIKIDMDYSKAYTNLGITYGKIGKYADAITALKAAINLKSDDPMTFYALGQCYLLYGKKDSALVVYDMLKSVDESMAEKLKKKIDQ